MPEHLVDWSLHIDNVMFPVSGRGHMDTHIVKHVYYLRVFIYI